MNNETDLFEIRYAIGGLQYRQRKTAAASHAEAGNTLLVLAEWGSWQFVPAVKCDESDSQFD